MNAIEKTLSVPHTLQEEGQHCTNRASSRKGQGGSGGRGSEEGVEENVYYSLRGKE